MKKVVVILVLLLIVGLAQAAHAVDLEAGWYVKVGLVGLFGWSNGTYYGVDWDFVGGLGTYEPFHVTSPSATWPQRLVGVASEATTGIAPGTSVYLWGQPRATINFPVSELSLMWETCYVPTKMRLDVLMYKESSGFTELWSQDQPELNQGARNILSGTVIPVGYQPVFRVTVVPEPSTVLALAVGVPSAISILGRRGI